MLMHYRQILNVILCYMLQIILFFIFSVYNKQINVNVEIRLFNRRLLSTNQALDISISKCHQYLATLTNETFCKVQTKSI